MRRKERPVNTVDVFVLRLSVSGLEDMINQKRVGYYYAVDENQKYRLVIIDKRKIIDLTFDTAAAIIEYVDNM